MIDFFPTNSTERGLHRTNREMNIHGAVGHGNDWSLGGVEGSVPASDHGEGENAPGGTVDLELCDGSVFRGIGIIIPAPAP